MKIDRRSFLRVLGGVAALLTGRAHAAPPAASGSGRFDVHQATRNTRLGALGARRPRLSAAPLDHKPYPGARRVELPAPVVDAAHTLVEIVRQWAPARRFGAAELTLAQLGRLLHYTNGVTLRDTSGRGAPARRAAPSAGALYAGEVYVAAARVQGLAPGIYNYEVARHRLVEVARGFKLARLAEAIEVPAQLEGACAVILLTNDFGRYSWRYANRSYRYALIDSGHIGENLRLAAASAGLAQRDFLDFRDDLLNALLAIDGAEEAVCSVHAIGAIGADRDGEAERGAARDGASASDAARADEPERVGGSERSDAIVRESDSPRGWVEAQSLSGFEARGSITERYHAATQLVPGAAAAARAAIPAAAAWSTRESDRPLPARAKTPAMRLEDAIQIRRSTTRFETQAISLEDLALVLELAHGHAALARSPGIELDLVVHRVASLAPGLYRYDRDGHQLGERKAGSLVDAFSRVCLGQAKAGSAAVGVLMIAHLGEARGLARTRRYRDLLVEAGAIGQRIYLAAESLKLSARNLAAFLDDDLNALLGLDGEREAAIHLTMLGAGD